MAAKFPPKYVYTTGDPNAAKDRPSNAAVVIKLDGGDAATDAQIEAFIAANPSTQIIFFMQEASEKIVEYSKKYNANGVIIGGESESQMSLGLDQQAGLDALGVAKLFTTGHNYNTSAKWPPGWGVEFQFYPNDPNWRPSKENMLAFLQTALSQGATSIGFAAGSWGTSTVPMSVYQEALNYLKQHGVNINTLSAFTWEQMTDEQKQGFLKLLSGQGVTAPQPTVAKPTIPSVPVAASPPTPPLAPPSATPKTPPHTAPPLAQVNSQSPLQTDASSTGGYHMPASEYAGGAKVIKTIWGANGTRTDITETGAVIQTAPDGGTPQRAGWVDPNKISSFRKMDDLKGNILPGPDGNPFMSPPPSAMPAPNPRDEIAQLSQPPGGPPASPEPPPSQPPGISITDVPVEAPAIPEYTPEQIANIDEEVNDRMATGGITGTSEYGGMPVFGPPDDATAVGPVAITNPKGTPLDPTIAAADDSADGSEPIPPPAVTNPGALYSGNLEDNVNAQPAQAEIPAGSNSTLDPAIATAINSHPDSRSDRPKDSSDDDTRSRGGITDPMGGGAGSDGDSASPTNGNGTDPYFAAHDPQSHFGGRAVD